MNVVITVVVLLVVGGFIWNRVRKSSNLGGSGGSGGSGRSGGGSRDDRDERRDEEEMR